MHASSSTLPVVSGAEECWAMIAGHRMRYLRAGNGSPVLLLHGLTAYSFSWRLVIPSLSSIRTVFAPDQLGSGFSDQPSDLDYGMAASARRLWKWLDDLGVGTIDLVGSSLGGGIAVRMTALEPERVNKLVLAAPVNPWSSHGRWIAPLLATRLGGRTFMATVPLIRATGNFWLRRLFGDPKRIAPGTIEGYAVPLTHNSAWEYGLAVARHWRTDMRQLEEDYVALADKPSLLIWGDRDPAVSPSSATEILHRMKNARLEVLKGVGHIPYDEVPEEFTRLVVNFLGSV